MNSSQIKLFDKLNGINQSRIKKNCSIELINTLKEITNIYTLQVIDMLIIFEACYPTEDFNYFRFKLLFDSSENQFKKHLTNKGLL